MFEKVDGEIVSWARRKEHNVFALTGQQAVGKAVKALGTKSTQRSEKRGRSRGVEETGTMKNVRISNTS